MAKVLAVGIATLDIINSVERYPHEDDEVRAISQRSCRGGNATNTLTVLSQLDHQCHWAGVLVDEPDAGHITADLSCHHVNTDAVLVLAEGKVPTSYITHNLANGSRTIIHHRDLPEYPFAEFERIDLSPFDWVHFEGRNIDETLRMLTRLKQECPTLRYSIELEKARTNYQQLLPLADILLFSKVFARNLGFDSATAFLSHMQKIAPQATLVCAWGEDGAYSLDSDDFHYSPAFAPAQVVDTLGAGDTFNAGFIDAQLHGLDIKTSLRAACQLAGQKCGVQGFDLTYSRIPT